MDVSDGSGPIRVAGAMTSPRNPTAEQLNGIGPGRQQELRGKLADARRMREFSGPWSAQVRWAGGFRTEARMRGHHIAFDEPGDLAAGDSAASPHEFVLSALGACLVAGIVLHATLQDVRLTSIDVQVSGTFDNILRWAGLESTGNPGYRAVELRATIAADVDDDVIRDIWDRALSGSPVAQTVSLPTPVIAVMEIAGRSAG
jgi:uncharacterized OsmC-like protein